MQIYEWQIIYVLNGTILQFLLQKVTDSLPARGNSRSTTIELYIVQLDVSTPVQHFMNKAKSLLDYKLSNLQS